MIASFNADSNLFDRDNEIVLMIRELIEKRISNSNYLEEKENEFYNKYKELLENYEEIKEII